MADLTGKMIAGRYRVEGTLGSGGMAVVYKAYDTRLETEVAVKVIATENLPQSAIVRALKRFEREAKALARLTHQNIVKVTDYGEYEGRPYLVMPYLPGGTLRKKLGKPIPWTEAVELILPIAEALRYAHSQHVIHRDVKPSNIILTQAGHPLLTDFGIAKLLDLEETVELTGTSASMGTPEYMAPEQARAKEVDHRADIYSLGIVLYEMATGRKPFVADTPMEVLIMQARDPLPSPRRFAPNLSDQAEAILLKALAKKPEDRYQTMEEMYAALKAAGQIANLSHTVEKPRPRKEQTDTIPWPEPPAHKPTISQPRPMPTWVWGVIGVVVVLVCIALGSGLFKMILPLSAPSAPTRTSEAPTNGETSEVSASPTFAALPSDTPSPTDTPALGAGSTQVSPKDGMTMMFVPAGEFTMGDTAQQALADCQKYRTDCQLDWFKVEEPPHQVYLDSYWMDQTEVTNAMYEKCVNAGVCQPPSNTSSNTRSSYYGNSQYGDYPVIYVNWNQAKAYCEWAERALPTEAQWEKAASWDDDRKEKRVYPWGDSIDCTFANYWRASGSACTGDTTRVGDYPSGASFYGLLDMAGNAWEWVMDWYDSSYYSSSPSRNPQGPSSGGSRLLRGGSWLNYEYNVRSAFRYRLVPSVIYDLIGFRCSRSP